MPTRYRRSTLCKGEHLSFYVHGYMCTYIRYEELLNLVESTLSGSLLFLRTVFLRYTIGLPGILGVMMVDPSVLGNLENERTTLYNDGRKEGCGTRKTLGKQSIYEISIDGRVIQIRDICQTDAFPLLPARIPSDPSVRLLLPAVRV